MPIVLKGIQTVRDAKKCVEMGVQGIVVSNHGGRQVDGCVASLDMLPEIADAVKGKIDILFDSGVRTGSDIIKALALGADAVLIGRPYVVRTTAKESFTSRNADKDHLCALPVRTRDGWKGGSSPRPSL